MPWMSEHTSWLVDTGERLSSADGKTIEVWEFKHEEDDDILSAWAKHFRNHYCSDDEIDMMREGTGLTRSEYLTNIKFPDESIKPGPSIRSGDFGEVLVADYLQYKLGYWVPRTRYSNKVVRNESAKGSDVIGFKFYKDGSESSRDVLAIFEAKARFSQHKNEPRLQDAVNDSSKDHARKAESLNAIKQRLYEKREFDDVKRVSRFQDLEDRPYKELSGAVALFSSQYFDSAVESKTNTQEHNNSKNLFMIIIHGKELMALAHELYRRAASEA